LIGLPTGCTMTLPLKHWNGCGRFLILSLLEILSTFTSIDTNTGTSTSKIKICRSSK
jgi:hypothetical protein